MSTIDILIRTVADILTFLIIINSILSFILPPYNPIRETLGRILEPLYAPLRRLMPPAGMFDFTPLILLVVIQVLVIFLTSLF